MLQPQVRHLLSMLHLHVVNPFLEVLLHRETLLDYFDESSLLFLLYLFTETCMLCLTIPRRQTFLYLGESLLNIAFQLFYLLCIRILIQNLLLPLTSHRQKVLSGYCLDYSRLKFLFVVLYQFDLFCLLFNLRECQFHVDVENKLGLDVEGGLSLNAHVLVIEELDHRHCHVQQYVHEEDRAHEKSDPQHNALQLRFGILKYFHLRPPYGDVVCELELLHQVRIGRQRVECTREHDQPEHEHDEEVAHHPDYLEDVPH